MKRTQPPATDVCRLVLHIRDSAYGVCPLPCETGRGWRLRSIKGGLAYEVRESPGGATCTCRDFEFRHRDDTQGCKHIRAMRALGLIGQ